MDQKFSVFTGNIGHSPYMFMWGNPCGLNAEGKIFKDNLQRKMDELKASGDVKGSVALGKKSVIDAVLSGEWVKYSSSPQREEKIGITVNSLLKDRLWPCFFTLQELGLQSVSPIVPANSSLHHDLFTLSLPETEKALEKVVERGNAVFSTSSKSKVLSTFTIEYDKPGTSEKKQTRRVPCYVVELETGLRITVCSVHLSGYNSRAYLEKDPIQRQRFQDTYTEIQRELDIYANMAEEESKKFNSDIIILSGDFNQCGNTDDYIEQLNLVSHKRFLYKKGFMEDDTANETTTFDPSNTKHVSRRLDRIFYKSVPGSSWAVKQLVTKIQLPPDNIQISSLSDHALFVEGNFTAEKQ